MKQGDMLQEDTLQEARKDFFNDFTEPNGTRCPCCNRTGQLYTYPFSASMGSTLIWLYQHPGHQHLPTVGTREILSANSVGKLIHWDMASPLPNVDDPTKNRTGWWEITERGRRFVRGQITLNSHVLMYNKTIYGWKTDQVTMSDVLKKPFHFRDLMENKA